MNFKNIKIFCLCREWRTRTQLLCCTSAISLIVIVMVGMIEQLLFDSVQKEFINSSRVLFESQTEIQLRQFMNEQVQYAYWFFEMGSTQLTAINDIYQLVQQQNLLSNVPPYDCLSNSFQNDTYAYSSSFCYMFCNTEKQIILSDHKDILNLTALLTQYQPIFDNRRIIYYAGIDEDSFLARSPGANFGGLKVQQRPWYKTYLAELKQHQYKSVFSNPYYTWGNSVAIAQNSNLTTLSGQLNGLSGQDFELKHILLMNNTQESLIIANASGFVMVGSYYKYSQKFLVIYNESVTGFTYQDWELMKLTADNNSTKILKMNNSVLKTNIYVTVQKITHPKYYFIIFSEFPEITQDEKIIGEQLLYFQQYYNNILIITVVSLLAITLLQMLCIVYIIKPVERVGQVAKEQYSNKFNRFKQLNNTHKQKDIINPLLDAYHNMTDNFTNGKKQSKCAELQFMDNITYPEMYDEFIIDRDCFNRMILEADMEVDVLKDVDRIQNPIALIILYSQVIINNYLKFYLRMLSKYATRLLISRIRPPFYKFSQEGRSLDAEQSNPKLETKEQAFSYFRLGWRVFWWSVTGLFMYNLYLNNYKDAPKQEIGYVGIINDAATYCQSEYQAFYDFITKPPIDKLLPDIPPLPFGYEIPKTLVLNMSGTLIHMDYVFGKGADIKKRVGLQKFLAKLSKMYEVVILTDDDTMFTQTICEKLDPTHQIFAGRFGRESHVLERNHYIKDLKYLNRPLHRVVVVESNPDRLYKQQDNGIFITKYDGQEDNTLSDLLPLLEHIAKPEVKDIREELRKYGNYDPQIKFKDEMKVREINIQQNMKKGVMGLFDSMAQQKKKPNTGFDSRKF